MKIRNYTQMRKLFLNKDDYFKIRKSRSGKTYVLESIIFKENKNKLEYELVPAWEGSSIILQIFNVNGKTVLSQSVNNCDYDEAGEYTCKLLPDLQDSIKKMKTIVKNSGIKIVHYYIEDELI